MTRYEMTKDEIEELRTALKNKWEHVNKEYQTITHLGAQTGLGMKRKYGWLDSGRRDARKNWPRSSETWTS